MFHLLAGLALSLAVAVDGPPRETILYSFDETSNRVDGAGPLGGVIGDGTGALYGTAVFGGKHGLGAAYKLTPRGGTYSERILYNFHGPDGGKPEGLVADGKGALFGFALIGGAFGRGVVYKLTPSGFGYRETVLYSFRGGADGAEPLGRPVIDEVGAIYGVTSFGGALNGTVFKLTHAGAGYSERIIYRFPGGTNGYLPQAGLTRDAKTGTIFGTTYYGGDLSCSMGSSGCGTVFKILPRHGADVESIVYRFRGGSDGLQPLAPPTVDEATGNVFGTTEYGGAGCSSIGCGTVYGLSPSGNTYSETVLYSFTGRGDGFLPSGSVLLHANGKLYGTADIGGRDCNGIGCGVVFSLRRAGTGYTFSVVHWFTSNLDGAEPEEMGLIADKSGALYGTTRSGGGFRCADGGPGGTLGCGVVFKIDP